MMYERFSRGHSSRVQRSRRRSITMRSISCGVDFIQSDAWPIRGWPRSDRPFADTSPGVAGTNGSARVLRIQVRRSSRVRPQRTSTHPHHLSRPDQRLGEVTGISRPVCRALKWPSSAPVKVSSSPGRVPPGGPARSRRRSVQRRTCLPCTAVASWSSRPRSQSRRKKIAVQTAAVYCDSCSRAGTEFAVAVACNWTPPFFPDKIACACRARSRLPAAARCPTCPGFSSAWSATATTDRSVYWRTLWCGECHACDRHSGATRSFEAVELRLRLRRRLPRP